MTAAPPLVRPTTASCTVTLVQNQPFPFAGYGTPFTGPYAPPAACPAPWSMVVLDFTGSVAGRQFDRMAAIWVGSTMIYMGTTPEPTPAGITWHVEKDVSEYAPILGQPRTFAVQIPNLVNSRFTGIIYATATLTFYGTSAQFPAAPHPDVVVPLSGHWLFLFARTPVSAPAITLPRNPVRAYLEMWAKGNSCDEFWYANQPDAYASANGLCGGGAFREIKVFLDDTLAGVVWPFPYIFTGGINPYLWRPIPAVDGFNEPPYIVDLSPFVGGLADGQAHTLAFEVANNGFYWNIDGNLLIYRDPGLTTTSGQVTTHDITSDATQGVSQTTGTNSATFSFTASRSLTIAGYVDTSSGRVTTTVHRELAFTNDQVLNLINFRENLKGTETITTLTGVAGPGGTEVTTVGDSYPIALASMFMIPASVADPNANSATLKFILPATVDQSFDRTATTSVNGATAFSSSLSDSVHAEAILIRSLTTGVNAVAGGHDDEHYIYSDSAGTCFNHLIQAAQGFVTVDKMIPRC